MWVAVLDLVCMEWLQTKNLMLKHPVHALIFFDKFDKTWCATPIFTTRSRLDITWNHRRPTMGYFV